MLFTLSCIFGLCQIIYCCGYGAILFVSFSKLTVFLNYVSVLMYEPRFESDILHHPLQIKTTNSVKCFRLLFSIILSIKISHYCWLRFVLFWSFQLLKLDIGLFVFQYMKQNHLEIIESGSAHVGF